MIPGELLKDREEEIKIEIPYMSISIIIPHQNKRPEMLKECLGSIKNQSQQPLEIIQMIGSDYPIKRANDGIKKAKGKYILLLSDDDKLSENWIELVVAEAEKHNADIVSTFIELFGEKTGRHGAEKYPFFSSLFKKELWEKIGGLDEDMLQMADIDFYHRALKSGAKWIKMYEPVYYYRVHPKTQDSGTADWSIPRERFIKKHGEIL
jgi:glycosyltransferase involved in cell wall biosynthesis